MNTSKKLGKHLKSTAQLIVVRVKTMLCSYLNL